MEEEEQGHNFNNLKGRRKKSSTGGGGFCCFGNTTHHHHYHHHRRRASFDGDYSPASSTNKMRRSPSSGSLPWFKSKPDNTKSRNFMSRIGGHRRHASADQFSYDPLSYALNFDDDAAAAASSSLDDHHAMSFTARLPSSPPARTTPTPDHHKLPRPLIPRSPSDEKLASAGKEELRRGFEALSMRIKSNRKEPEPEPDPDHIHTKTSKRAAAVADVRRTLEPEEVISPPGISSNRGGLLVQLC